MSAQVSVKVEQQFVRGIYMMLFLGFLYIAWFVLLVIIGVNFVITLLTGSCNENLRDLGRRVTMFVGQTLLFLTYNSNDKPYPFSDWPK